MNRVSKYAPKSSNITKLKDYTTNREIVAPKASRPAQIKRNK